MIIWLIIWLIIWWLFVIICLWLFDKCDDYLMIIWWLFSIIWLLFGDYLVIIRWLFDDYSILDYLMIIRCLFDDYLQFRSGSLLCSFLSSGHLVIMLGLPTLWATNYRQLEARRRRRWRGRYWVINRTWLRRLPLRRLCCGGTIRLIQGHERQPAIRRNPQLLLVAEGLLWKLPAKMRKWSAKDLNIVCRIHAFPKALSTTSRKDAWRALFTTPQKDTLTRHEATRALRHPCAHS